VITVTLWSHQLTIPETHPCVKVSVTVLEFVRQYVDLKPTASGAIGVCPFHDDHHPSFGINEDGNCWQCFARCSGGVRELAEMLLRPDADFYRRKYKASTTDRPTSEYPRTDVLALVG